MIWIELFFIYLRPLHCPDAFQCWAKTPASENNLFDK